MTLPPAVHDLNVTLHALAGTGALCAAMVAVAAAKGSRVHRRAGVAFRRLGVIVIVTAALGLLLFRWIVPLAAATLAAAYPLWSGTRALSIHRLGPSRRDVWAAACAVLGATALLVGMRAGTASWTPALGYGTAGGLAFWGLYDLSRQFWWPLWQQRYGRLDHGVKLWSAATAMLSAVAGNTLRDWQPWSALGPIALGLVGTAVLIRRHRRAPRHAAAAGATA